jgi:transitional endoplasmic reticulum ATPase
VRILQGTVGLQLKVEEALRKDVGRFKARLSSDALGKLRIQTGDIVEIKGKRVTSAIAWSTRPDEDEPGIIRMDGYLRRNAGVSLGDKVSVKKASERAALSLVLTPLTKRPSVDPNFEAFVKNRLVNYPVTQDDIISVTMITKGLSFLVAKTRPSGVVIIKPQTSLHISEKPHRLPEDRNIPHVTYEDVGGLYDAIFKLREIVELPLKHPELFEKLGIEPPRGVLLYGPSGCGKTLLARAVANESDAHFVAINGPEIFGKFYGESEKHLREVFKEAEDNSPAIIFIDEIDAIAPKREDTTGEVERRIVAQLLSLMDGLQRKGRVIVTGATNRANSIDPALRRPGRFDREIELPVPTAKERLEILQIHTRWMPLAEDVDLEKISDKTHGFVGADLAALCREAAMHSLHSHIPSIVLEEETIPSEVMDNLKISMMDFDEAFRNIQPSAMREILVEMPSFHWSDIGGLEQVKQELLEVVEWPTKKAKEFSKMGVKPPRSALLFGPPGCGKTLLAKAVATESAANFISIRGPEVISKWVGESEKAIREIFRKARSAAPAVVFIDEIDSIARKREYNADGSNVPERVVSQLLTEMDELAAIGNVAVICATNRPDVLEPALLRPGRIDRLVYVPPPNTGERVEILSIYTRNTPMREDVDLKRIASETDGYVGADLENLCREAAVLAIRERSPKVGSVHFREAMKKIHPIVTPDVIRRYESFNDYLRRQWIGQSEPVV